MYLWDITLLAIYIIFLGVVPKCVTVALHMCGQFSLDINSDEITMNIWIKRGGAPGRVLRVSLYKIHKQVNRLDGYFKYEINKSNQQLFIEGKVLFFLSISEGFNFILINNQI